ncbi:sensor domain-containing protein [Actinomycetospora sp. CA-084318]|uniref:sensor domain-containing protein n=1 Tax=Actinomycetospora sp. CA-084318 TaxID=3239892 RepID=UPI003D97C197
MTETTVLTAPHLETTTPRWLREAGYLLAGLPAGVAAFTVAVIGLSAGVSTLIIWIGLPILALTLRACRGLAVLERRATTTATGRAMPPHHYRTSPDRHPALRARLTDPQAWRDLLHAVVGFPVLLGGAVITLSWGLGGLGGLVYVAWEWALPRDGRYQGLYETWSPGTVPGSPTSWRRRCSGPCSSPPFPWSPGCSRRSERPSPGGC